MKSYKDGFNDGVEFVIENIKKYIDGEIKDIVNEKYIEYQSKESFILYQPYSIISVAYKILVNENFIIDDIKSTKIKIYILSYLSYCWYLGRHSIVLCSEVPQARNNGPLFVSLYEKTKNCSSLKALEYQLSKYKRELPISLMDIIDEIVIEYSDYTLALLEDLLKNQCIPYKSALKRNGLYSNMNIFEIQDFYKLMDDSINGK